MGLLGLFSRSIINLAAFGYPSYASYKSISTSDHVQTERWLVYWTVVGALTGAEGAVGWIVGWVPFYSEIKLGVMLWMVAPQTEGSTYLYRNYLSPLFTSHERDVDALLGDLRFIASGWIQRAITYVWNQARDKLNLSSLIPAAPSSSSTQSFNPDPSFQPSYSPSNYSPSHPIPPSLHPSNSAPAIPTSTFPAYPQHQQPHSNAFNYAASLVSQYAPLALAAGQAHLSAASANAGRRAVSTPGSTSTFEAHQPPTPTSSSGFASGSNLNPAGRPLSSTEIRSRRAQLEAELAALASPPRGFGSDDDGSGSGGSPWEAGSGLGQSAYESIGRDEAGEDEHGQGGVAGVGAAGGGGGWFGGWGGNGGTPKGYEKVGAGGREKRD